MISFITVNKYCKDDISLIENYEAANNDTTQTWDCHHRLETDLGLTPKELIEQGKYFNVPANELIFLTKAEHRKLHYTGEKSPRYGRRHSDEAKEKNRQAHLGKHQSEETRKKRSQSLKGKCKGENCYMYGKHPTWMNNGIVCVFPRTQEEIDRYLELGYHFGRK